MLPHSSAYTPDAASFTCALHLALVTSHTVHNERRFDWESLFDPYSAGRWVMAAPPLYTAICAIPTSTDFLAWLSAKRVKLSRGSGLPENGGLLSESFTRQACCEHLLCVFIPEGLCQVQGSFREVALDKSIRRINASICNFCLFVSTRSLDVYIRVGKESKRNLYYDTWCLHNTQYALWYLHFPSKVLNRFKK